MRLHLLLGGLAWLGLYGCTDDERPPYLTGSGGSAGTGAVSAGGSAGAAAGAGGAGGTAGAAGAGGNSGAAGAAGAAGAGATAGAAGTGGSGTGGSGTGGSGTGGSAGAGGADGPSGDCDLDPDVVHVVGEFGTRFFALGSVITPLAPTSPRPRSCFALPATESLLLRPDGSVLYSWGIPGSTALRQVVPETIRWNEGVPTWYSPINAQDDDLPIGTPGCGAEGPFRVLVFPDTGALLYDCYQSTGGATTWFRDSGAALETGGLPVLAAGHGGRVLTYSAIHSGSTTTPLSGIDMNLARALRGVSDGFWVVKDRSGGGWQRHVIGFDGVAAVQGTYPALPTGWGVSASTVTEPRVFALAPSGDLYVVAADAQYTYAVMRAPVDGAAFETVYLEGTVPAEDWDTPLTPPDPAAHLGIGQPLLLVGP